MLVFFNRVVSINERHIGLYYLVRSFLHAQYYRSLYLNRSISQTNIYVLFIRIKCRFSITIVPVKPHRRWYMFSKTNPVNVVIDWIFFLGKTGTDRVHRRSVSADKSFLFWCQNTPDSIPEKNRPSAIGVEIKPTNYYRNAIRGFVPGIKIRKLSSYHTRAHAGTFSSPTVSGKLTRYQWEIGKSSKGRERF